MTFTLEEILAAAVTEAAMQVPRHTAPVAQPPQPPPIASQPKPMIEIALFLARNGKRVFPCNPLDKTPLVGRDRDDAGNPIPGTGGLKKATTDIAQINTYWGKWPNAMVGLPTGEPAGVWAVEIDISDKKTEIPFTTVEAQIAAIEAELGVQLPETRRIRTPRGGEHWLYRAPDGDYPRNAQSIERGGNKLNGIDIRGSGGYVICAGSRRADGKVYAYVNAAPVAMAPPELLDWAHARGRWAGKKRAVDPGSVQSNLRDLFVHPHAKYARTAFDREIAALGACPEGSRNEKILKVASALGSFVAHGLLTESEIRCAIENVIVGWDNVAKSRETMENGLRFGISNPRELPRHITESAVRTSSGSGITVNDFYAYMPMHQYIFGPSGDMWPGASVNSRIPPIKDADKEITASQWIDRNRPVEQMTWAPGMPRLIHNKLIYEGGWFDHDGVTVFNLYKPPRITLGNANKAGRWIEHVRTLYLDDADHLIKWCACRVQRPEIKINHALVLGGKQGIGKDTILEPLKYAVGPWNFREISPEQALQRFNSFLKSTVLRISEARDLGEHDRFALYERLKAIIAAPPDVLRVDEKNIREHMVPNVTGVIFTTNNRDALYLPQDDRRHFVVWSELAKEDFDEAYWNDIWGFYDRGGIGDVAAYLHSVDISAFNPKAPPPKTDAFWTICAEGRRAEAVEMADALEALGNPDVVTIALIFGVATAEFQEWLGDRKNGVVVARQLDRCGYTPARNPDAASDGMWRVNGKRITVYAKSVLPPAARIAAVQKFVYSFENHPLMRNLLK